jgi:hypothetical protein
MISYSRDRRIHSWRWQPLIKKWGHLKVFIDPSLIKTAAMTVINGKPDSTVFFVEVPLKDGTSGFGFAYYAITTRHSIHSLDVSIRFNLKGNLDLKSRLDPNKGTEDKQTNSNDWIKHPSTDLAILPLKFPLDAYDIEFLSFRHIVTDRDYLFTFEEDRNRKVLEHHYGVGDEVFSIGLFGAESSFGMAQSVVRFGHIAFKPKTGEQILANISPPSTDLESIDAFLVEIATWPGQSGSPVFLRLFPRDERVLRQPLYEFNFLVGMIQGLYPGEQDLTIDGELATLSPLYMGVGIVIPSEIISEMLMTEELKTDREQMLKDRQNNPKLRPAPASPE